MGGSAWETQLLSIPPLPSWVDTFWVSRWERTHVWNRDQSSSRIQSVSEMRMLRRVFV